MKTSAFLAPLSATALLAGCAARGTTPTNGPTDQRTNGPTVQQTNGPTTEVPGENQTDAMPALVRLSQIGSLSIGEAEIGIVAFAPGWSAIPVKAVPSDDGEKDLRRFVISGAKTYFNGSAAWTLQPDGVLHGRFEMECAAPVTLRCLAVYIYVPDPPPFALGNASAADFDLSLGDGRALLVRFPESIPYFAEDHRPWSGKWSIRFGETALDHRSYAPGERFVWDMTLSTRDGFALGEDKPIDIIEGADWVRLDYHKDIVPGSALDLSAQGLQDAPAGKHGWLKAVGGHFEFEGLPGVEQRFYGVNLCFTANYPDHDLADRLVDRFVRCGYNTIRVHHHDGAWAKDYLSQRRRDAEREQCQKLQLNTNDTNENANLRASVSPCEKSNPVNPVNPVKENSAISAAPREDSSIDRLDYLLAKCYERGIYVTTDLYVSRPVAWREIGIDRDGDMDKSLFKTYVGIHDGAFMNWCHWAQAFLEHVNPYTGRANKDEPGMPLISLINEGIIGMKWGSAGKASDPVVRAAWMQFNEERGIRPAARGSGEDAPLADPNPVPNAGFEEWHTRRVWERCAPFVRSLGCRALLTNDNNGPRHGDGEGATPLYDYVDSHFYVDHPQFLEQSWKLPSRCTNVNPIKGGMPGIFHRGWSSAASSKPCAITEWNFSGPGRYRGMGGILTGAYAAEQRWDGLWRFAYSHSNGNLLDGQGNPGYFDCVTDPLIAASDRASVCLFLRGDATQENEKCRMNNEKWKDGSALRLDAKRGSMAIVTPRTCGGFAASGRIEAGPLSFNLAASGEAQNTPATLWASSLDGEPLERSSRILLTHLTDVQGNGARYADESRKILLKWGRGCLIEAGEAEVSLKLSTNPQCSQILNATNSVANVQVLPVASSQDPIGNCDLDNGNIGNNPAEWRVWALDTAGNRVAEVPYDLAVSGEEQSILRFRVCTAGPEGGRIYYEIVR